MIASDEVKPFTSKASAICGFPVKVTVDYASPPNAAQLEYPVKNVGAYLSRAAPTKQLTLFTLTPLLEALTGVAADAPGKAALKAGLKELHVLVVNGGAQLRFENGVLTVGSHLFGDGEGSSVGAKDMEDTLSWGLLLDEPVLGRRVPLPWVRVIKQIKTDEELPFQKRVSAIVGFDLKVSFLYDSPANASTMAYPVKDPARYLLRGAKDKQVTLNLLTNVEDALKNIASDALGKAALKASLKELHVLTVVGDAQYAFENGVYTVGSHIYGDGEGSSFGAADMTKHLLAGLMVDEPLTGKRLTLEEARAIAAIETNHLTPFRAGLQKLCGAPVKVTAVFTPFPDERGEAPKNALPSLARWARSTDLTISFLDRVTEALTDASEKSGAKAVCAAVKEVRIPLVMSGALLSFEGGVLTVGRDQNSGYDAGQIRKAVEAKVR